MTATLSAPNGPYLPCFRNPAYLAAPNQRWTVQALASVARLGRTVFAERFRAVFGAPPLETLTRMRLDNARDRLTRSRTPLSELAYAAGYGSEAAFVRAFHRRFGVTPGRFRACRMPPVAIQCARESGSFLKKRTKKLLFPERTLPERTATAT